MESEFLLDVLMYKGFSYINMNIPTINHLVNIAHTYIFLWYGLKIFWLICFWYVFFKKYRVTYLSSVFFLLRWEPPTFKDFTHTHFPWSVICSSICYLLSICHLLFTLYSTFFQVFYLFFKSSFFLVQWLFYITQQFT